MSARLRTLRNASASTSPHPPNPGPGTVSPKQHTQPQVARDTTATPPSRSQISTGPSEENPEDGDADLDPLFHTDDHTLDEFLKTLDLEDDVSLDHPPPLISDPRDEAKKVAALLEELGKPTFDPSHHDKDDQSDDDSDGEEMTAKVKQVLLRALDEAELDRSPSAQGPDRDEAHAAPLKQEEAGPPNPSPPQDQPPKTDDTADPFSLPAVPSQLVDPAPSASRDDSEPADFESSIAARMAALKGVSYGAPGDTDAFGLPQAPSFNPDERAAEQHKPPSFGGWLHGNYTDEDQKTWCVVCLEDATIKCIGCDDDVYCGRCWRDMHVGPRAGYDERGHQWVKFVRGR